jgi:beta-galactosidase
MEDLNQNHGLVLYRKKLPKAVGTLTIKGLHDYALLFVDGEPLGELRRGVQSTLDLNIDRPHTLDILVSSLGRVNFGAKIVCDLKGIVGCVMLNETELEGWEIASFPLDRPQKLTTADQQLQAPAFYKGSFDLKGIGDTFLDMRGWGFGFVWVNGHNLGRFWHIGPQQTLYLPGAWLKLGQNEVVVLDLLHREDRSVSGLKNPIWS